ncbi:DUF5906 domain-containing protein [Collimonas fungivorans]
MGMALKAEYGDDARDAWLKWSSASDGYNNGAALSSWKSFKNGGKIGIGSLFSEAQAAGFSFGQDDLNVPPEILAAQKKARDERAAKAESDRLARAAAASNRAKSQWRMAAVDGVSPYLERKQVVGESCRYLADGAIVVPMMRYDAEPPTMVGKQQINADGSKKYSGGMDKTGAACRLGQPPTDGDAISICEGYATGLSVRAAYQFSVPVFIAFDTSGLLSTARILRARYPSSPILFCADDDYLTGGKGVEKAQAAATDIGNASVVLPVFTTPRRATKTDETLPMLTDFNDLHCAEGLAAVSALLYAPANVVPHAPTVVAGDSTAPEVKQGSLESLLQHFALVYGKTDVWDSLNKQLLKKSAFAAFSGATLAKAWLAHPDRKTIDAKDLPLLKGGRAISSRSGGGGDPLKDLHDRYVLLYGTETVWDRAARRVVGLAALRAAYPDLAGRWLESPHRTMVDAENLVFDPSLQVDPETHINMFNGYPLVPQKNDVLAALVLELLESLCSSERNGAEVFEWLLKWLAYPLQNPGAKMSTAVLMFGEKQGTGKSLFFDGIMRPIYGEYGTTAGQHQLESTFTDWRSRKTFVLFEEVLGRAERHNYIGTIKHMITGKDMRINPKGLPERVEDNHLNSVFLSNERQPLPLDAEDRRFLVVEALNHMPTTFYSRFKQAIKDGASAAFYEFLLSYPVDDFNEHSKPLRTDSKDAVITFGLPSWEVFYQRWRDSEVDAPYCSCVTDELHAVYQRWCERAGEKKLSLTKFSELISGREVKSRKWIKDGALKKKMRTVLLVGEDAEAKLDDDVTRFRNILEIKA